METGGETSPPPPTPPSEGTTTITRSDPLTPSDSFEEDQPVNPLSEDLRGKIVRQARTILVENLPQDYSTENMQKIFGNVGKINEITICDPHLAEESANNKKVKAVSSKLHALIEYETVETAKSAVATLNDEKNWRTGMRVEILLERMIKYGLIQKDYKETLSEKKTRAEEPNTDAACVDGRSSKATYDNVRMGNKREEKHLPSEQAARKGRYKSRGRGQLPQNSNKDGNDHGSSLSSEIVSKPLPGPKMPDGTRGFTMGRGKPIV